MAFDNIDEQELVAVRHIGTLCAGAIALIAITGGNEAFEGVAKVPAVLAIGLLLLGVFGSGAFQLIKVTEARSGGGPPLNRILGGVGACCLVLGLLGFVVLAFASTSLISAGE